MLVPDGAGVLLWGEAFSACRSINLGVLRSPSKLNWQNLINFRPQGALERLKSGVNGEEQQVQDPLRDLPQEQA